MNDVIEQFWQSYVKTLPPDSPTRQTSFLAEQFGDSPAMAEELAQLIQQNIKTATCSALWAWEKEGETLPEVGQKTIVCNGQFQPVCIIEVTEVQFVPFYQVSAEFAFAEGESDRSLENWRTEHWQFFARTLAEYGLSPTHDMPLVCEKFKVIFPGHNQ